MIVFGQQDSFIYKLYDPPLVTMIGFEPHYFDLNEDGIPEFYFQEGSGGTVDNTTLNGWEACIYNPDPDYPYTYQDPDIAFDDASIPWGSCFGVYRVFENNVMRYVLRAAMRIQQDGDYYYGWWDGYVEFGTNPQNALLTIRETCFCTISNYPLHFGQTSLYWDIEENGENTLLIIYPNPVSDRLNIHYSPDVTPKAVELYDLQGRLIKTQDSNLENIGMENVPAGNYTLRVVMERGENYTEKVVKAH